MDERLLEHYNTELRHLREMAGEFAREFPKIAGRLALDKDAKEICPDPYVERLLEGFAFLAARIHLKLDSEFPRFTQALLETVYPHYLSPIPSMSVVRFDPSGQESALGESYVLPRGTQLRSTIGKGERTACTFQTAHEVRLVPVRIAEIRYFTRDIAELNLPPEARGKAAFRIRLQALGGAKNFQEIDLAPLSFFIRGADELPGVIYEQIFARKSAVVLQSPAEKGRTVAVLSADNIQRSGFAESQALLPASPRGFEGYRLLREYFAFPQRFLFFDAVNLGDAPKAIKGEFLDLIIVLKEAETKLEGRVDSSTFELFCTPAINLFSKTLDRISLSDRFSEFHVMPDRNRPLDFEVFEMQSVTGYDQTGREQEFRPFYLARDADVESGAFFTTNRIPRVLTTREKQFGRKSTYSGTEVYLSLVDAAAAPYRPDLRQLGIKALCTNRHLPIQMSVGVSQSDFTMDLSAPVTSIRCLSGPTVPRPSHAIGNFSWRLISHLALNYLSLVDSNADGGAASLRDILRLYADANDRQTAKQIEGLVGVKSAPIVRRVKTPGPITFARGIEISLILDDLAFEGVGPFILGAVLEQFFAKYVSLNSFTETVVKTQQRGEIMRWPAQMGKRQIL